MEDFGEIIYFVLLIAFALLGGLSKKGKKNKGQQGKTAIPDIPKSWEDLEKKFKEIANPQPRTESATQSRPVVTARRPVATSVRTMVKAETPRGSSETIYSSENDQSVYEVMSYDTIDDVSKLRVKKQMKESISKKHSTFKNLDFPIFDESVYSPVEIEFENLEDVRKAFIYSEIFSRKYS